MNGWHSVSDRNRALRGILQRADRRQWGALRAQWASAICAALPWIGLAVFLYVVYVVVASGAGR